MNTRADIINADLERAKNELNKKRDEVKWTVEHDINFGCFERNLISTLLYMIELKERIAILERYEQIVS